METVRENLCRRKLNPDLPGIFVDEENRVATFLLYNVSGKIVGFQQYRPDANKEAKNDPREGRYFTYITDEGEQFPKAARKHIAFYGTHTLNRINNPYTGDIKPVFIVEGIFDAAVAHYHGMPAVAVLQNDPKKTRGFFAALGAPTIAVCDGDDAGKKLGKMATIQWDCPKGEDLASWAEKDWEGVGKSLAAAIYYAKRKWKR